MKNRILLSVENFYPRIGGGEVFIDELITELSKKHICRVIYAGENKPDSNLDLQPVNKSKMFKNIPLFNRTIIRLYFANKKWEKILEKEISRFKPNIIITQLEYLPATITVAKRFGIKAIAFLMNYDHFCPFVFKERDPLSCSKNCFKCSPMIYKLQFPFVKWLLDWHKQALIQADYIFSPSVYMKKVLKHFYNIDSVVLHSVIYLDDFKLDKKKMKQKYITFINPIETKGAAIVFKIAKQMKGEEFLVVGGVDQNWIKKFKSLDNVEYISWTDDMKKIYAQTKILLMPSTWPEPLGRVPLEVELNGIPVISSNSGGLAEAVGKGGIVIKDLYNTQNWIKAINRFNDKSFYKKISRYGKIHAKKSVFKEQMKKINKALEVLTR